MYICTSNVNADNYDYTFPLVSCSTRSLSCLGQEFRRGAVVCTKQPCDEDYPEFMEVSHVLVHEEAKYLVLKKLETVSFSHHYFAYPLETLEDYTCMLLSVCNLALQVFHKYCIGSSFYVVVRSCDHVEFLI